MINLADKVFPQMDYPHWICLGNGVIDHDGNVVNGAFVWRFHSNLFYVCYSLMEMVVHADI